MRVLLKRDFFWQGNLYKALQEDLTGTEVPDDAILPRDAKVWDGKDWIWAYPEEEERQRKIREAPDSTQRQSVGAPVDPNKMPAKQNMGNLAGSTAEEKARAVAASIRPEVFDEVDANRAVDADMADAKRRADEDAKAKPDLIPPAKPITPNPPAKQKT